MGAIDPQGNWLLPAQYQQIRAYEGLLRRPTGEGPQHLFTTRFHRPRRHRHEQPAGSTWMAAEILPDSSPRRPAVALARSRRSGPGAARPGEYQALDYLHDPQAWQVRDNRLYGLYRHQQQRWLLPCAYPDRTAARLRGADGSHYCRVQEGMKRWGL